MKRTKKTINRTIEELKFATLESVFGYKQAINRTIEELKCLCSRRI